MSDIELVVKIDEEDYKKVLESNNRNYEWNDMCSCYEAVFKGTPLPKGLGTDKDNKIIRVGDEIYSELTDSKAVVHHIDAWNRYECFTDRGSQFIIDKHTFNDYWVKTGKNYPQIAEVLKQMKEGK